MQLIEIFKAGKRKDTHGTEVNITVKDLQKVVEAYDVNTFEAPVVIGHPEYNHPAYAWVKGLHLESDVLKAELHQVDPAFSEMVKNGRYKKISASFYLPDSENNPKKGALYLRHVGFLGAMAPAVKGLKNPIFAENEQGVVDFSDYADNELSELEKLKAENARLKNQLAINEKGKILHFAESLIRKGKLAPVAKENAVELLNFAERYDQGDFIEFGENESLLQKMQDFFNAQPQIIYFGEIATKERASEKQNENFVKYAENTPPEMIELDQEIRTYASVHKLSYSEAFDVVHNQKGE
ncbi:peptidase [Actinobacillus genomosp. 2]|uniref:peptidase n=1 Tax=Actinobacillus genomosp. 2 TaxID=230709 RepID=UPI002442B03B|nr:peptidase [Actinobacillus genomosp. 2]WGE32279.1 peptidase [Actinobacillus genomosp. 2]